MFGCLAGASDMVWKSGDQTSYVYAELLLWSIHMKMYSTSLVISDFMTLWSLVDTALVRLSSIMELMNIILGSTM